VDHAGLLVFYIDILYAVTDSHESISITSGLEVLHNGSFVDDLYNYREARYSNASSNYSSLWAAPGSLVLEIGDVITLKAGTMTLGLGAADTQFLSTGEYDMFLKGNSGVMLSSTGVVPEPATASMMALVGGLGFLIRRHLVS